MKQYKKYNFILIAALMLLSSVATGQKIESYRLVMPKYYLSDGGPIYIKALKNLDGQSNTYGEKYANALKAAFNSDHRGMNSSAKMYNPWYTTKLYTLTDDESKGNYIIDGQYSFSGSSSEDAKEQKLIEAKESNNPRIPYHFYEYTASSSASVEGELTVFRNSDKKVILTMPFKKNESVSKSDYLRKVNPPSVSHLKETVGNTAINQYAYYLIPYYSEIKYDFENVKSDDKDYNKELRKMRSDLKDLADDGKVNELGKAYLAMLGKDLKNPEDANLNIGMCYELIGNFTKAKAHYDKSGNSDAISRIDLLIKYRDIYKSLNIEVVENEF
jgi:hypothetical protein